MSVLKYKDPVTGEWKYIAGGGGGGAPSAPAVDTQSVKYYGAKGDGVTDDTAAFQKALAAEQVVTVPNGTYILSDTITIGANCCFELSQATVLKFTQTGKNCISMLRLASLHGNHATIFVPYTFSANVINADGGDDFALLDPDDIGNSNNDAVPPFRKWDPQWKMSRYVTDINICKPNASGFHYSDDGKCYGTAVYIHCNEDDYPAVFMWGVSMSGIRIAGGFNYGIRIQNIGDPKIAWNHDMRMEAVIYACKIGVSVENSRYDRLAVTIQPIAALNGTLYAEHGIKLTDARGIDLSSSRVWDWNAKNTLWAEGNEYQHIALYGDCEGIILDDFLYYEQPSSDIRDLIYTNNARNLETMTILQEPITRWFKIVDGDPYFSNGHANKKLITQEEFDNAFDVDIVKGFTDALANATDAEGNIYNGIGYKNNTGYYNSNWSEYTGGYQNEYYFHTGFIPVKAGDIIYGQNLSFNKKYDGNCRIVLFDSAHNYLLNIGATNLVETGNLYAYDYVGTDNSFALTIKDIDNVNDNVAYIRFQMHKNSIGDNPMMSINNEIKYRYEGFLADGVKVKGNNVILTSPSGKSFKLSVADNGALTAEALSQ